MTVDQLKAEAKKVLNETRNALQGLMLETTLKQKRDFVTSDFIIDELRRLTNAVESLNKKLEKLP